MASLKDRINAEKTVTPTATAVNQIMGIKKKSKYPVNVVFDGNMEETIRNAAKENGVGVATYIKQLVFKDINTK